MTMLQVLLAAEPKSIFYATPGVWNAVIQLGIIAALMLISNMLRRIPFIRKSLMPVSVIAGFLMLAIKLVLDKVFSIKDLFNIELLDTLVYHCIALGFIAMSLRTTEKAASKGAAAAGVKSGAMIVATYLVQGLVGLAITIVIGLTIKPDLFKAAGLLLPMGYGQGPGQANNIGMTYESLGFAGGQSFGLAIAAAGYIVACTVGVVVLNFWKRKKKIDPQKNVTGGAEELTVDYFQEKNEIPVSDSIDKLSVQMGFVLVVYLVTYLITKGVTSALDKWAPGVGSLLNSMLWGFNFIIGAAVAMLVKTLLNSGEKRGVIKRRYRNNYLLNRLSGFFFDLMIVAGIACIDPEDLTGLWLPFVLMAVAGGAATWFFLRRISRRIYGDYYYEGLISMYGMMTGTIGSGILLLREIDPEFSTPAANNLVLGSSYGILFGAPVLILVTTAAKSDTMCYIVAAAAAVYLALLLLFIRFVGNGKKKKEQ